MADIGVERRKKKPIWPWVIGLIVVLILIWLLYETFGDEQTANDPETVETAGDSMKLIEGADTVKLLREMDTVEVDTAQQ